LVPGLAFSPAGERLGQGGGYYDRFLPRLRPDCLTVGVVASALLVMALPTDPWDCRVSLVVTEKGVADPRGL
jgi:5-formyltetrahydrofolate cyclo-ligase